MPPCMHTVCSRSSKVDAADLDAFDSPNLLPLVAVGVDYNVAWDLVLMPPVGELVVDTRFDEKVVVVSLFPGQSCVSGF